LSAMCLGVAGDVTRRRLAAGYRRFGTAYPPHLEGSTAWPLKMVPISCPETWLTSGQPAPHITEERRFELRRDGSLNIAIVRVLAGHKFEAYA
jgi:hypothetical protein